jgi:uncharacterized surface protein with fasciclin (FAS1) repeats
LSSVSINYLFNKKTIAMFRMTNLLKLLFLSVMVLSIFACDDDDPVVEIDNTITAVAIGDADLSSLVAALTKVNLAATLQGDGPFTVFAPSNAAFAAFLSANGFASLEDVPDALLTAVLLNHVVSGENRSTGLATGYVSTLSPSAADANTNLSLYIDLASGVELNGISTVTIADIDADNGVIHKVDAVIGLPTIVTHALANANLSTLVSALTTPGTAANYVEILSGTGPFTVFAPTNDGFNSFVVEKGFASLGDIPVPTLEAVLQYHVVSGANVNSSALTDGMMVTSFEGTDFTINTVGGASITDNEGRITNIVLTDVQANNGIIHVVDNVLSPL